MEPKTFVPHRDVREEKTLCLCALTELVFFRITTIVMTEMEILVFLILKGNYRGKKPVCLMVITDGSQKIMRILNKK